MFAKLTEDLIEETENKRLEIRRRNMREKKAFEIFKALVSRHTPEQWVDASDCATKAFFALDEFKDACKEDRKKNGEG